MSEIRKLTTARGIGLFAILSLPAFVWFGWWQLGFSLALAALASILATTAVHHRPAEGRLARWLRDLLLRTNPHRWRPGRR